MLWKWQSPKIWFQSCPVPYICWVTLLAMSIWIARWTQQVYHLGLILILVSETCIFLGRISSVRIDCSIIAETFVRFGAVPSLVRLCNNVLALHVSALRREVC